MPSERLDEASGPLLTIAIPTYNRAIHLKLLLQSLAPQIAEHPEVDVYISDNASTDDTPAVVRSFIETGLKVRYTRHSENIGSDRNFVSCFEAAQGRYFWLCGDDDVILPGAINRILRHLSGPDPVDLMYLSPYAFIRDPIAEQRKDALNRSFQIFTDPFRFAQVVNIMFTFVSGMIVNRQRLLDVPHESPQTLLNTNLIQLGWCLPLLLHHRRSIVLREPSVAGLHGNGGGYSIGRVFGAGLKSTLGRLLPGRSDIQKIILDSTLRCWVPWAFYDLRSQRNERLGFETASADFRQAYGDNFRYWLFAYPVLRLPLPLARFWLSLGRIVNRVINILTVPHFWRRAS